MLCYPLDVIPGTDPGSTAVRTGRAYKNIKQAISQGDNFPPKTRLSKKERWIPGQARDDGRGLRARGIYYGKPLFRSVCGLKNSFC